MILCCEFLLFSDEELERRLVDVSSKVNARVITFPNEVRVKPGQSNLLPLKFNSIYFRDPSFGVVDGEFTLSPVSKPWNQPDLINHDPIDGGGNFDLETWVREQNAENFPSHLKFGMRVQNNEKGAAAEKLVELLRVLSIGTGVIGHAKFSHRAITGPSELLFEITGHQWSEKWRSCWINRFQSILIASAEQVMEFNVACGGETIRSNDIAATYNFQTKAEGAGKFFIDGQLERWSLTPAYASDVHIRTFVLFILGERERFIAERRRRPPLPDHLLLPLFSQHYLTTTGRDVRSVHAYEVHKLAAERFVELLHEDQYSKSWEQSKELHTQGWVRVLGFVKEVVDFLTSIYFVK